MSLDSNSMARAALIPGTRSSNSPPSSTHVRGTPLLIAVGPDGKSFRVFIRRIDGKDAEFFLKDATEGATKSESETPAETKVAATSAEAKADASSAMKTASPPGWALLDTTTASEWNFQGCAVSGPSQGKCLDRVPALKDYWFDWRNYHADTTIYKR